MTFVQLAPLLFLIAIPLFFMGLWLATGFLLAKVSGWASLAQKYHGQPPYNGPVVTASGHMRFVNFNGMLRLGADEECLHLSTIALFRRSNPPLSIPWSDIRVSDAKSSFVPYVRFDIGGLALDVPRKSIERLGRTQQLPEAIRAIGN